MAEQQVNWQNELNDLVSTAKNEEERVALEAFRSAISPYLDRPELLRTLLSKIAASVGGEGDLGILAGQGNFASLEELQQALPSDIKVVKL